ncbi:MAG: Hsp20/alpha crystallin family protein [Chitinivibrionales bacterium]
MADELSKREKTEVTSTSAEQLIDAANAYSPDVDIYDDKNGLTFVMDVPGVKKGDVRIEVDENNVFSVRAKSSFSEPQNLVAQEFRSGDYYRAFTISDDFDKGMIKATLENGVLEIYVPRREEVKPHKVEISA